MYKTSFHEMKQFEDYDEVEKILRSEDFASALHLRDSGPLLLGCVLTLNGEEHRERRRLVAPLFERGALGHYENTVMMEALGVALDRAASEAGTDGRPRIDLLWLSRMALVPVTAAMVGLDGVETEERIAHLEDVSRRLGEGASVEWSLRDHGEVMRDAMAAREEFLEHFYEPSMARRRELVARWRAGEIAEEDLPIDLITVVLKAHDDGLDEELWRTEAAFFVVASANTTTHSVPHIYQEILTWMGEHPDEAALLTENEVFLQHAVDEALRLHGVVPALLRRSLRDQETLHGVAVEEGEDLACMLNEASSDPKVYGADSLTFDPHRGETMSRLKAQGMAFGAGAHRCAGRPMAAGLPPAGSGEITVLGMVPRLVKELLLRGGDVDPADPPERRTDTEAVRYARYPIVFTNWTE
jgi:cytochrome P450